MGKIENCIVTVHLGYDHGDFKALLDSDLYLPQSWADDRERCRQAAIPDDLPYRPKTAIALKQVRHALSNGIKFDWLVFDEGYGKDPSFLFGLDALGQNWIGEVPKNFRCWPVLPQYHSQRAEFASKRVDNVARSPAFIYQVGSMTLPGNASSQSSGTSRPRRCIWSARSPHRSHLRPDRGLEPRHRPVQILPVQCAATHGGGLLLQVAFHRANIEHLFRLAKGEVGLSHFEGRSYVGLMRHMILSQRCCCSWPNRPSESTPRSTRPPPIRQPRRGGKKSPQRTTTPRKRRPGKLKVQPHFMIPVRPHATMEQIAASLNWLCSRWLERRHSRCTGHNALQRESFTRKYHQERNLASARSRQRRYSQNEGSL